MQLKPDLWKIITNDDRFGSVLHLVGMLVVVIGLLFGYVRRYGQQPYDGIYLEVSAILLLLSAIVLAVRWGFIAHVFCNGMVLAGTVTKVEVSQRRGYIAFVFPFSGDFVSVQLAVLRMGAARSYRSGDAVTVIASRENPQWAFIAELYGKVNDVPKVNDEA